MPLYTTYTVKYVKNITSIHPSHFPMIVHICIEKSSGKVLLDKYTINKYTISYNVVGRVQNNITYGAIYVIIFAFGNAIMLLMKVMKLHSFRPFDDGHACVI